MRVGVRVYASHKVLLGKSIGEKQENACHLQSSSTDFLPATALIEFCCNLALCV